VRIAYALAGNGLPAQAFERIARRAGVPVIRLHDLRHTHGTLLIKDLVPVKVVSERLGHANVAFTMKTYHTSCPVCKATPPTPSRRSSHRAFDRPPAPAARAG
jgi:hypothetical protein